LTIENVLESEEIDNCQRNSVSLKSWDTWIMCLCRERRTQQRYIHTCLHL